MSEASPSFPCAQTLGGQLRARQQASVPLSTSAELRQTGLSCSQNGCSAQLIPERSWLPLMVGHTTSGEALTGLELKLGLSLTSGKRLLYCLEGAEWKKGQAYCRPLPQAKPRKM